MTTILLLFTLVFNSFATQGVFVIIGSVRNSDGRAVDSIRVSLMNDDYQTIKTVFTDASGRFRMPALRQGVYIVRVMPVGTDFEESSQRVELRSLAGSAEETVAVDFVIRRKRIATENRANEVVFAQTIPDAARAEYKRGSEKFKDGKFEEGEVALKKAVELFPDYYLALELLGTEYVKKGEFESALPVLSHALEINAKAPRSLYSLGVAYLKLKRSAESLPWLQRAAEQDGGNPNVYMMLGLAYGNSNALREAETAFRKAYQLGGEQAADAHFYLAGIYNKQERYDEAVKELELYLKEANDENTDKNKVKQMIQKLKEKQKGRNE